MRVDIFNVLLLKSLFCEVVAQAGEEEWSNTENTQNNYKEVILISYSNRTAMFDMLSENTVANNGCCSHIFITTACDTLEHVIS